MLTVLREQDTLLELQFYVFDCQGKMVLLCSGIWNEGLQILSRLIEITMGKISPFDPK